MKKIYQCFCRHGARLSGFSTNWTREIEVSMHEEYGNLI